MGVHFFSRPCQPSSLMSPSKDDEGHTVTHRTSDFAHALAISLVGAVWAQRRSPPSTYTRSARVASVGQGAALSRSY